MSWAKRLARVFLGSAVSGGSRRKGARAPRERRVAVEALEDRRLLSGLTAVDTGVGWSSSPVVFGDAIYFAGDSYLGGAGELWTLDESENVSLVADINPQWDSAPKDLVVQGDKLYFSADNGTNGRELWCLDAFGDTSMVADIFPGPSSSSPHDLTLFNDELYFTTNYSEQGAGLWKLGSDGSVSIVVEYGEYDERYHGKMTVIEDCLYFGMPGSLHSLDTAGHLRNLGGVSGGHRVVGVDGSVFLVDCEYVDRQFAVSIWEIEPSGDRTLLKTLESYDDYGQTIHEPVVVSDTIYLALSRATRLQIWALATDGDSRIVYNRDTKFNGMIGWYNRLYFGGYSSTLYFDSPGSTSLTSVGSIGWSSTYDTVGDFVEFGDYLYFGNSYRHAIHKISAPKLDYGDAPESYGTTFANNGAQHSVEGPTLGAIRDVDSDGFPSATADGDDSDGSDDEDGVTFASATFVAAATVNVQNAPNGARLDAWIDFNQDGSFDGPGEQIADSLRVVEGDNLVAYAIPGGTVPGETYARFRLSSSGGLAPTGSAADGEVEDHVVTVIQAGASPDALFRVSVAAEGPAVTHSERGGSADIDGDYSIVGGLGAAFVYQRTENGWIETQELVPTAADSWFGFRVGISGSRAVVAGYKAISIFDLRDGEWRLTDVWALPDPYNGVRIRDVGIDGDLIAVAAYKDAEWGRLGGVYLLSPGKDSWETAEILDYYGVDGVDVENGIVALSARTLRWEDLDSNMHTEWGYVSVCQETDEGWVGWRFDATEYAGLGVGVTVHEGRVYGVATAHIMEIAWDSESGAWIEIGRTPATDIQSVAIEGDVRVLGSREAEGISIVTPAEHIEIPIDADVSGYYPWQVDSYVAIDQGTILHGVPKLGQVWWYDFSPRPEDNAVPVKSGGEIHVASLGDFVPRLEIYDPSGQLVASETTGSLTYTAESGGVFTVRAADEQIVTGAFELHILSELPEAGGAVTLGVVDDAEIVDAIAGGGAKEFAFQATHDGYLTILGHEHTASGAFGMALLDQDGAVVAAASGVGSSGGWGHEWRLDHVVTGGESYRVLVMGSGEVDLRICNLVSQTGNTVEMFDTDGDDAYLFSVSDTFDVTANGVDYRFDDATSFTFHSEAGEDTIEMVDSDGDDTLTVSPSQMVMSGTTAGATGFSATADGFRYAHGYAKAGGDDVAQFVGSEQADRAKAYDQLVKVMGGGYYARAKFFESVEIDMGDGMDSAVMAGSAGADVVWAMKDETRVTHNVDLAAGARPAFASMAYDVTIVGAERVVARARGADDWVELHDSALNDVLIARPHKVEMMNGPREGVERGAEYRISARGYQNVSAIADQGGDGDTAKLYDTGEEGVDVWAAAYVDGETWSTMRSRSRLLYEVLAFEQVGGYGFNGGLGEGHGTNRREHGDDVDFVFKYGYWEGDEPPVVSNPRNPRGR